MSKARSYKNEPYTSFEKQSYSIIKDDFVHEKLLTVKANIQSTNGGVNLKETLNQKADALTSTGETKLWFYLRNNTSLYTKVLPNSLTVAYDHGIQTTNGRSFNWFGGVETNRGLSTNVWKVGVEVFDAARWSFNNLIQLNQNDKSLSWLHKSWLNHNEWFFNFFHTTSLSQRSCAGSGWLVSYRKKGEVTNDFSARFEVGAFSNAEELKKSLWEGNKVTLDWVHAHKGRCAHGLEVILFVNFSSQATLTNSHSIQAISGENLPLLMKFHLLIKTLPLSLESAETGALLCH